MKKRLLSMVLAVIMLMSLIPMSVFAATKSVDDYFDGLPIAADPGTGTTAWKVGTRADQRVDLHTLAADLLREVAENAEAGDHRQRFGSRSLAAAPQAGVGRSGSPAYTGRTSRSRQGKVLSRRC